MKEIKIVNAKQNNLKGIDVTIPYYKLNVVTGNSGSGKSSLVYDTIYAESQRLMSESLIDNTFGMKIMEKPNVERIENLCPVISISQQSYNFNPNSSVNTFTDISSNLKNIYSIISSNINKIVMTERDFSPIKSKYRCSECQGTGKKLYISLEKLIPDKTVPLCKGGIIYFSGSTKSFEMTLLKEICYRHNIDFYKPIKDLTEEELNLLLYGTYNDKYVIRFERGSKKNCQRTLIFTGVINELKKDYKKIKSPMIQKQMAKYLEEGKCDCCKGSGFQDVIQNLKIEGYNIHEVSNIEMPNLETWCDSVLSKYKNSEYVLQLSSNVNQIKNITNAMKLLNVEYLTLSRSIPSLSGGEFQRLRLAKQIAGSLVEILYILDEPCKGLHRIDVGRIIDVSKKLVEKGNTVIAIEHNKEYISKADKMISLGPGSGPNGGYIVDNKFDFSKKNEILSPEERRTSNGYLEFKEITVNNIVLETCKIPLNSITCITGVSGSGKSTLAREVIYKSLISNSNINCKFYTPPKGRFKTYYVDQNPIGKNARSTVISYLKIYDEIRNIFSKIAVNKKTYKSSYFSMNCEGGRCEKCSGTGIIPLENRYFSDSYMTCDECNGEKFKPFILEVKYKGKNISDIMNMTILEALDLFSDNEKIKSMLTCIKEIGLEYLNLGQMSKNLSGGEAQRLKLAKAIGEEGKKSNIYILDEPTSGLSDFDIEKIEKLIQELADNGNTIIIIEHNIDFITNNADYIIDFGFHGGRKGGKIIEQGYIKDVFLRKKASVWYDEK